MHFTTSQAQLTTALQLVSRAIASRPSHPVLANVLLSASDDGLTLTGYDLSLGITTTIPAAVLTPGAITLPARLLSDIVGRLPADSPIGVQQLDGDQAELSSNSGTYTVRGMPAADYPDLPTVTGTPLEISADALARSLRATLGAAATDESKQLLTGAHLQVGPLGMECAAIDGHRLAILAVTDGMDDAAAEPFAATVPARSLRELERLLAPAAGPLQLTAAAGQLVVRTGDHTLITRTLDGTYPNYRQLLPPSFDIRVEVDRRAFTAALDRVAVLADQHSNVIKLAADAAAGLCTLRADAQDVGSGSETLAADITGADLAIAFNVRYLLDGLKAMATDRVALQANSPTTPAVLVPVDGIDTMTYLVMPIQVREADPAPVKASRQGVAA